MEQASLTTAKIEIFRGDLAAGTASGFFYKHSGKIFLITNWHVLTGVNPETSQTLDKTGLIPDRIRMFAKVAREVSPGTQAVGSLPIDLQLYDSGGSPLWLEHPQRHAIDIVALPWTSVPAYCGNVCINEVGYEPRLQARAGLDCFILGHPEGISGPVLLPIWKRGSIASEPHPKLPTFLVDSATRQGMSGSPVIARHSGLLGFGKDGMLSGDSILGTAENFVGVYSGRLGNDALGFQLGRVWKSNLLDELFNAPLKGKHPLHPSQSSECPDDLSNK